MPSAIPNANPKNLLADFIIPMGNDRMSRCFFRFVLETITSEKQPPALYTDTTSQL